ncbi:hypothetical protein CDL15_Pgr013667 [Punica granatum]|uniref:GDSL esterase/lipase At5g03610-like n=1 Tax=Punica granatum TaxID=22663 RepID=A0A218W2C9_PUNGR|nr:hypothetical protein CDL15_Pgr013667 [Punica granatum]
MGGRQPLGVNDKPPAATNFILFDLYNSFSSVLNPKGNSTFQNLLKPCCVGTGSAQILSVDSKTGEKKYSVCSNPERAFFWDMVHPTQEGWRALSKKKKKRDGGLYSPN